MVGAAAFNVPTWIEYIALGWVVAVGLVLFAIGLAWIWGHHPDACEVCGRLRCSRMSCYSVRQVLDRHHRQPPAKQAAWPPPPLMGMTARPYDQEHRRGVPTNGGWRWHDNGDEGSR
jgi:hypothetical protein